MSENENIIARQNAAEAEYDAAVKAFVDRYKETLEKCLEPIYRQIMENIGLPPRPQ